MPSVIVLLLKLLVCLIYCNVPCLVAILLLNHYISVVRPHLEYASIVWNAYTSSDIKLLEAVQNRVAHWICAT